MAFADGSKSGGRRAGTPNNNNKAQTQLQTFLSGVFTEALECPAFRRELLAKVKTLELDTKVLLRLLEDLGRRAAQVPHARRRPVAGVHHRRHRRRPGVTRMFWVGVAVVLIALALAARLDRRPADDIPEDNE